MKKTILAVLLLAVTVMARAQFPGTITIVNNLPWDMNVALFGIDAGNNSCSLNYGTAPFIIPANSVRSYTVGSVPNGWTYGTPNPPPVKMLWEAARVYDNCNLPYNATVGDPACYQTNGNALACMGPYTDIWDPAAQTLTINP